MIRPLLQSLVAATLLAVPTFAAGWDDGNLVEFSNIEVNGGCKCLEARFKRIASGEIRYYRYYYEESGNSLDQAKTLLASLLTAQQGGNTVNILYTASMAPVNSWDRFAGVTVKSQ